MADLKLLIIDDESGMREGMRRSLRNYCLRIDEVENTFCLKIETAKCGEEALEIISESPPDIMLLDNKLPGIQGMDILQQLNGGPNDITVIMITAYASIESAVSATKSGAFDFLAKPFTPDDLKSTISKAIRHVILQRHAKKLTEEKRRTRFDLLSVVSHELKAPLSALESHLYLLEKPDELNSEMYNQSIERCFKRVRDMRKLINDFLDLTRIESGQKVRRIKRIDLQKVLLSSIETISDSAAKRKILVGIYGAETIRIQADRNELEIIFNNLLSNAIKYNRDKGKVTVTFEEKNDLVFIHVSDTGIGMSQDDIKDLFKEFYRIRNRKTENITGSGLGLAIVHKIVAFYGGSIDVESEQNVGTTITIQLPKNQKKAKFND